MKKILLLYFVWLVAVCYGQDPLRFKDDVANMLAGDSALKKKNIILFTGSSSIVKWTTLQVDFPNKNVLNRGFGGSETSDLVYYASQVIYPYKPKKIFIYEGDNDLNSEREPSVILANYKDLLRGIREKLPKKTRVYFISPKPSLARWNLKEKYQSLNSSLKNWLETDRDKYSFFIDIWPVMLEADGAVKKDLFVEDGLHMNAKGYQLWKGVIGKYVN